MDLKEIMNELTFDYCSEKDFQINLAMKLKEEFKEEYTVICEYPVHSEIEYKLKKTDAPKMFEKHIIEADKKNAYIDIVCIKDKEIIPIELKYRTKYQEINKNGIKFNLTDQSAHDDGCYGFLRDICRIKELIEQNDNCNEGYAIFLTNDDKYHKKYNGNAYSEFWFGEQKNGGKGPIFKEDGNVGKVNGTYRKLDLPSPKEYNIKWDQWKQCNKCQNDGFSFLVIKIEKSRNEVK